MKKPESLFAEVNNFSQKEEEEKKGDKKKKDKKSMKIYDENGDGIEDFRYPTYEELDSYYQPAAFGVVESIYNTLNGRMPGFETKWFDDKQVEYPDSFNLQRISEYAKIDGDKKDADKK